MAQDRSPKISRVSQDESKMASRWLPNPHDLASSSFFYDFQKRWKSDAFSNEIWSLGALKVSTFLYILIKFHQFCIYLGILGRVCPKRPQDSLKIASSWLTWANLGPTWAQVGSKLAHLGPNLGRSWLQLGSSRAHVGSICGSPATPGPTQALPDPFPAASQPPV